MVQLTFSISLRDLVNSFVCIYVARLFAKVKINKILTFGAVMVMAGVTLMANSTNIAVFYLSTFVCGIGCSFLSNVSISMVVKNWFKKNSGTALGIVYASSGLSGAIFNPIMTSVIETHGYKMGYYLIAALTLIIVVPCTLSMKLKPDSEEENETAEQTEKKAAQNNASFSAHAVLILTLMLAEKIFTLGLSPIISSVAISKGHSLSFGAILMSCSMIGNVGGKTLLGMLSDKKSPPVALITACIMVFSGLLLILFLGEYALPAMLGSLLFGASYFVGSNGITALISKVFTDEDYARTLSVVNFINALLTAGWTTSIGYIYDLTGSYNIQLITGALSCLVTIAVVIYTRIKRRDKLSASAGNTEIV